jgi:hypothetical protein
MGGVRRYATQGFVLEEKFQDLEVSCVPRPSHANSRLPETILVQGFGGIRQKMTVSIHAESIPKKGRSWAST